MHKGLAHHKMPEPKEGVPGAWQQGWEQAHSDSHRYGESN